MTNVPSSRITTASGNGGSSSITIRRSTRHHAASSLNMAIVMCLLFFFTSLPSLSYAAQPCTITNDTCPVASCSSCVVDPSASCSFVADCVTRPDKDGTNQCNSYNQGFTWTGAYSACGTSKYQFTCSKTVARATSQCAGCQPYRYGSTCLACPGPYVTNATTGVKQPCNGRGTCSDGLSGVGTCSCASGWAGSNCTYSDAITCNGHGTATSTGGCVCSLGYTGTNCSLCQVNYFNVGGTCVYCSATETCSGHGVCTGTGQCSCTNTATASYQGSGCDECLTPYWFQYPTCKFCNASSTCNGHGTCSALGACNCISPFTGTDCSQCQTGYYGSQCTACPGGASTPCSNYGTCSQGASGTGVCTCSSTTVNGKTYTYRGTDCTWPVLGSISPANGPNGGSTYITLTGISFPTISPIVTFGTSFSSSPRPLVFDYSAYSITIRTLAGTGTNIPITVWSLAGDKYSNQDIVFSYDPPSLSSYTPLFVNLTGGIITILGASFGTAATPYFNGTVTTIAGDYSLSSMVIAIPQGQGFNIPIQLQLAGVLSNVLPFRYGQPVVTGVLPAEGVPTTGGVITLQGYNFGLKDPSVTEERPSIVLNGRTCVYITHTNTRITCTAPAYRGTNTTIAVTLLGATGYYYNYRSLPPAVFSATGCPGQNGNVTTGCPIVGNVPITITGNNFGEATDCCGGSHLYFTVAGAECKNAVVTKAHTEATCTLPAGFGVLQTLAAVVNSSSWYGSRTFQPNLQRSAIVVSYASPTMTKGTLTIKDTQPVVDGSGLAQVHLPSTYNTSQVSFHGVYFGDVIAAAIVTYGPKENVALYNCTVTAIMDSQLNCTTDARGGVGGPLYFKVTVNGVPGDVSVDSLWFPAPIITPGTLVVYNGAEAEQPSSAQVGSTNQGQDIYFDGENFAGRSGDLYISITYGPVGSETKYPCSLIASTSSRTRVSCTVAPGEGSNNVFRVGVGSGTSAQYVIGTDTYSYPVPPELWSVSGCTDSGNATTDCPTDALSPSGSAITITLRGQYFGASGAGVTIGITDCENVVHDAGNAGGLLRCTLPEGTNILRPVVVARASVFSQGKPLISYASPTVTSIRGCSDTALNNTELCLRAGGQNVTLTGKNFGAGIPKIVIAGAACDPVWQFVPGREHYTVKCRTPPGIVLGASVLLIQKNGLLSSDLRTLGYQQCQPGTYSLNNVTCNPCPTGSYSNTIGAPYCTPCDPGNYQDVEGQTECKKCPSSTFGNTTGLPVCYTCPAGYVAPLPGAPNCDACPQGTRWKLDILTNELICDSCATGSYSQYTGQTQCSLCGNGTSQANKGQATCAKCAAGTYAPITGMTVCSDCGVGTISEFGISQGAAQCVKCLTGDYADSERSSTCTACPLGNEYYNGVECRPCNLGYQANVTGLQSCTWCPPGTQAPATGFINCQACPVGTASDTGAIICPSCATGKYQSKQGQTMCLPCPLGSAGSVEKLSTCPLCDPGSYADVQGLSLCKKCPAGTHSNATDGAAGSTGCAPCAKGKYSSSEGFAQCSDCARGYYQNLEGQSYCTDCSTGSYAPDSGMEQCTPCAAGTYTSERGKQSCTGCEVGKHAEGTGNAICASCEVGKSQSLSGQATCDPCPPGSDAHSPGASTCSPCAAGTYSNVTGLQFCAACPDGRYSVLYDGNGATVCTECAPGSYAKGGGASECTPCDKGTYTNSSGTIDCPLCDPGSYQDTEGQTECTPCAIGKSVSSYRAKACVACTTGRYMRYLGAADCDLCPPGSYQDEGGQTSCKNCTTGQRQGVDGQQSCDLCDAGRYTNIEGQAECFPCPVGTYTESRGAKECDLCDAGYYNNIQGQPKCIACDIGNKAPEKGYSICVQCTPGQYNDLTGQAKCYNCSVGESASSPGKTACDKCAAGSYSNQPGIADCPQCDAGKYQDITGQVSCLITDVGHRSGIGADAQIQCDQRQIAPYQGMSVCQSCDAHSSNNQQFTTCICYVGWYAEPQTNETTEFHCLECPVGSDCSSEGTTWDTLSALEGWWRSSNDSLSFYRCLMPQHCIGGRGATLCGGNRMGPLCAICLDGYKSSSATSACTLCPKQSASIGVSFIIFLAAIVVLVIMYYIVLRTDASLMAEVKADDAIALHQLKLAEIEAQKKAAAEKAGGEGTVDAELAEAEAKAKAKIDEANKALEEVEPGTGDGLDDEKALNAWDNNYEQPDDTKKVDNAPVLTAESRSRPNFTFKLKIVLGFLQIGTNLAFVVDIPWPRHYTSFIQTFNFVSFDFVPWQSVGCVTLIDYYTKFLMWTILPVGILVGIVLFVLIPMLLIDQRDMSDNDSRRLARKRSVRKFWKLVLFTIFLLYPGISGVVINMLVCKQVDGVYYMVSDFTIKCLDDRWHEYLGVIVTMVLVYPVGIPLIFGIVLYLNRKNLMNPGIRMQLGFLYEAYNLDMWWFELVDMAHKLSMTSLLKFVSISYQMPTGMVVVTIYILVILLGQPYLRKGDDRLHLFVQIELLLVVLAGFILVTTEETGLPESTDVLLSTVMIIMTVGIICLFVFMATMNIRKLLRAYLRKKREEKDAADAKAEEGANETGTDYDENGTATGEDTEATPRHGTQIVVPKHRARDKNKALAFADQQMAELATMKTKWASI